jgi:nicotinic acid phosphoribosyltransferase
MIQAYLDHDETKTAVFEFFLRKLPARRGFLIAAGLAQLQLLHELVPSAVRVAVLLNPANPSTAESALQDTKEAAPAIGLKIQIFSATTIGEIDAAFAIFARQR